MLTFAAHLDPFAEADEEPGDQKAAEYIHIRIQRMSTQSNSSSSSQLLGDRGEGSPVSR